MQQRTKISIIIASALALFGLLVTTIFDLFPSKQEPLVSIETPVVLPDRNEALPTGAVFDQANADDFAAINPSDPASDKQGTLERDAQDLAVFFIERFGTYSSDAGFSYIDDLSGFMTDSLRSNLEASKLATPARDGFYSITADLASVATDTFSPSSRSATFSAVLNRSETAGGNTEQYQQEALVLLKQSGSGSWLVDSVVWGNKL
ncbi:MAG: hypothetical protein COU73_04005 [Parcubacteria group bacterium CG10_big_fil_rev_8_21_14_0_10_46_32]|nr:MAG: hypothetical protein COU73_04005 [Parcubacteria group bacterium CG10_big_fil_rev_8_21_14_0_10_46_32]